MTAATRDSTVPWPLRPWHVRQLSRFLSAKALCLAVQFVSLTGCIPCGPLSVNPSEPAAWQVVHSISVPLWPCSCEAAMLSLAAGFGFGHSACVPP